MRTLLGWTLATLVLSCCLSADDKKDEKIDAKRLVGKWSAKNAKEGRLGVIEFTKDGEVAITITSDGKETKREGTYQVDGDKLSLRVKSGNSEAIYNMTVTKLTNAELVTKDDRGQVLSVVRVKDK